MANPLQQAALTQTRADDLELAKRFPLAAGDALPSRAAHTLAQQYAHAEQCPKLAQIQPNGVDVFSLESDILGNPEANGRVYIATNAFAGPRPAAAEGEPVEIVELVELQPGTLAFTTEEALVVAGLGPKRGFQMNRGAHTQPTSTPHAQFKVSMLTIAAGQVTACTPWNGLESENAFQRIFGKDPHTHYTGKYRARLEREAEKRTGDPFAARKALAAKARAEGHSRAQEVSLPLQPGAVAPSHSATRAASTPLTGRIKDMPAFPGANKPQTIAEADPGDNRIEQPELGLFS